MLISTSYYLTPIAEQPFECRSTMQTFAAKEFLLTCNQVLITV